MCPCVYLSVCQCLYVSVYVGVVDPAYNLSPESYTRTLNPKP